MQSFHRHRPTHGGGLVWLRFLFILVITTLLSPVAGAKLASCSSDKDCDGGSGDEYCAAGLCRPAGTCAVDVDCINSSNDYIQIDCVGYITCSSGKCKKTCSKSPCANNTSQVRCLAEPCAVDKCKESHVSCVDDYCGGCNSIFFNAKGEQVCKKDSGGSNIEELTCTSDSDCDDKYSYCSKGVCQKFGYCDSIVDCVNPSNAYPTVMCVGYLSCTNNTCGITCSDQMCRPGKTFVDCPTSPCKTTKCNQPYENCVPLQCNYCNAIFINATGHQVCPLASFCTSNNGWVAGCKTVRTDRCKAKETWRSTICQNAAK